MNMQSMIGGKQHQSNHTVFQFDNTRASGNIANVLKSDSQEHALNGIELTEQQKDYLLPHFSMLIVGKPGSGKTSLVKALLTSSNYYYKKFEQVIIISPSANKMGIQVRKHNINQQLDLKWLEKRLFEINQQQVRDIIKELKNDGIIRPFQPQREQPLFAQQMQLKKQTGSGGAFGTHPKKDATQHKLLSSEVVSTFEKSTLMRGKDEESKNGNGMKQVLAEYVDEMHQKYVQKLNAEQKRRTYANILIVMDDVVSQIKANENNPLLSQLFFNRRHLIVNGMVSIMVISQKYTMVPVRIRSNINWLVLYRLNPIDFENVYKDVIMMPLSQWKDLLQYIYGDSYSTDNDQKNGLKNHDTLGIWVEFDVIFKNFQRLKINSHSL